MVKWEDLQFFRFDGGVPGPAQDSHYPHTGAITPYPDEILGAKRNGARHLPHWGRAASIAPTIDGVDSNDTQHQLELDGHKDSALSNHQDGQFAQNTAATSQHSQSKNFAASQASLYQGYETIPGRRAQEPLEVLANRQTPVSVSELQAQREARGAQLLVKEGDFMTRRVKSFFTDEWTVPQLGTMALGTYALYSIATRM